MATKSQLIARIANEVDIVSETFVNEINNVRTYQILHKRVRGINAQGRRIMVWVYDENGANEEAIMSYRDWQDVPIGNRYRDYLDGLGAGTRTKNEGYMSVNLLRFRQINAETKELIGVWNSASDALDVYESGPVKESIARWPAGYPKFGEGYRSTDHEFNPNDGKANAIKVPIFEFKGVEQPQNINFIDVANHQIVVPEGIELMRVDLKITLNLSGARLGKGTNFFFQWQQNDNWYGKIYDTGYLKGDTLTFSFVVIALIQDVAIGTTYFDFWCWTAGRQGTVTLGDVDCICIEYPYDPNLVV